MVQFLPRVVAHALVCMHNAWQVGTHEWPPNFAHTRLHSQQKGHRTSLDNREAGSLAR